MADEQGQKKGHNWVDRLIRAMQNLPGWTRSSRARPKPDPEEYAWKETEEEYQKAQAEWLEKVRNGRKKKRDRS